MAENKKKKHYIIKTGSKDCPVKKYFIVFGNPDSCTMLEIHKYLGEILLSAMEKEKENFLGLFSAGSLEEAKERRDDLVLGIPKPTKETEKAPAKPGWKPPTDPPKCTECGEQGVLSVINEGDGWVIFWDCECQSLHEIELIGEEWWPFLSEFASTQDWAAVGIEVP